MTTVPKTECKYGHGAENYFRASDGKRYCRECHRLRKAKYHGKSTPNSQRTTEPTLTAGSKLLAFGKRSHKEELEAGTTHWKIIQLLPWTICLGPTASLREAVLAFFRANNHLPTLIYCHPERFCPSLWEDIVVKGATGETGEPVLTSIQYGMR